METKEHSPDEVEAAFRIIEEISHDYHQHLPADTSVRAILTTVRLILRTGEGESILTRAAAVMRRADKMSEELGRPKV